MPGVGVGVDIPTGTGWSVECGKCIMCKDWEGEGGGRGGERRGRGGEGREEGEGREGREEGEGRGGEERGGEGEGRGGVPH